MASSAASVPSAVMISARASTGRLAAAAAKPGVPGGATGGAPGAGASGRIGVWGRTGGRDTRSRASGNDRASSLSLAWLHPIAAASAAGSNPDALRIILILATRTPTKQPPCHRKGLRRLPDCYRRATGSNGFGAIGAIGAIACRSPARPQIVPAARGVRGVLVSEEELGDLFRRYAPYVATIGVRLLGRDDELDDLVQEVFIEAYRGLHQLRSPDAIKAWLARITVRRATRRLRRRRLRAFLSLESLPPDARLVDDGATPEEKAEIVSSYRMVERIPVRQRVVWVLKHVEGETLDAIAEICSCSKATVQRRLRAAERALRIEKERQGDLDGRLRS